MAAPAVLQQGKASANFSHIVGALIVTVSVIAMGEPVRLLRYLNVIAGAALVVGSFIIGGGTVAITNGIVSGVAVAGLSIPRGKIMESFGTWDRFVR